MALAQEKKGGPYTKDEKTKRQNEVFRLHIELGYSAVKISEMMKVNRNTINDDIKFLYSNLKEELKESNEDLIARQIGRLEAQRTRNIENIIENKIDDIKHEKLLLDIDKEINKMLVQINSGKQVESKSFEIQEEVIKDIVLFLIIKHASDYYLRKEDIISEIINLQQCKKIEDFAFDLGEQLIDDKILIAQATETLREAFPELTEARISKILGQAQYFASK